MTPLQAEKEIETALWVAWKTNAPSVAGGLVPPDLRWEDREYRDPPDPTKSWARVTVKHADGDQASLGDFEGVRRWESFGVVIVQCFGLRDPQGKGKGKSVALELARVARDAFRGARTPGGIVFTRASIKDVGPDKGWWQCNAVAEFSYDEVK